MFTDWEDRLSLLRLDDLIYLVYSFKDADYCRDDVT